MATMEHSIVIQAPLAKVIALAHDPYRWHTWFAGLSEPEKVSGNGDVGTVVEHHYLMMGMRFPVTSRVLMRTETPEELEWQAAIEGPLSGKQHWRYKAEGDATHITAHLEYTVPGKILGKIANRLVIERMQERGLQQTLENLKMLCEAGE